MRYWVHADTFDVGDLKGKATKVLEEASEACEAARSWERAPGDATPLMRRNAITECCDVIQAALNLAAALGATREHPCPHDAVVAAILDFYAGREFAPSGGQLGLDALGGLRQHPSGGGQDGLADAEAVGAGVLESSRSTFMSAVSAPRTVTFSLLPSLGMEKATMES